jgi:hypothetical protein
MSKIRLISVIVAFCMTATCVEAGVAAGAAQESFDQNLIRGMKWRLVGPLRGGRVLAVEGIPGSGLYKSTDSGLTWKRIEGNGLPEGILWRIGVSVSAADPNRVYALIEAGEGGLYRSDDRGENWTRESEDGRIRQPGILVMKMNEQDPPRRCRI